MSTFSGSLLPTDSLFLRPLASSASQKVFNKPVLKTWACTKLFELTFVFCNKGEEDDELDDNREEEKQPNQWDLTNIIFWRAAKSVWAAFLSILLHFLTSWWATYKRKLLLTKCILPPLKTYQLHLFVANIKIWHHSWIFSCLSPEIQIWQILESESGGNLESPVYMKVSRREKWVCSEMGCMSCVNCRNWCWKTW